MVQDGVPGQINVTGKAAPQVRWFLGRCVAVANGIGIVAPVGVFAVAVLAEMAPLTFAAGDVMLHEDEVALPEAFAAREFAPCLRDGSDVLVPHDHGTLRRGCLVEL